MRLPAQGSRLRRFDERLPESKDRNEHQEVYKSLQKIW